MSNPREKIAQLKTKAEKLLRAGKCQEALQLYQQINELDPKNDHSMRRIAEMHARLGNVEEAKGGFKRLASLYAKNGFWAKAVSINKMVLELDPHDREVQRKIVELYASLGRQSSSETSKAEPAAPSTAPVFEQYCSRLIEFDERGGKSEVAAAQPLPPSRPEPPRHAAQGVELVVELNDEVIELSEVAEEEIERDSLRVPLFSDFSADELAAVMQKLSSRRVPANTQLCQVGERGDSMYVIASGSLEVWLQGEGGERQTLAHLRSGDFFGEFGLISDGTRHANVVARSDSELLEMSKDDLREIAKQHPGILKVLGRYYRDRVMDTLLRQSELFSMLTREERLQFLSHFTPKKVAAKTNVVNEGEEGGDLYFIKSGKFVVTIRRLGDLIVIAELGPGDFFGEIALVTGQRRTATITATSASEVLHLPKEKALAIMVSAPLVREKLEQVVARRAEDAVAAYRSHQELKKQLALV